MGESHRPGDMGAGPLAGSDAMFATTTLLFLPILIGEFFEKASRKKQAVPSTRSAMHIAAGREEEEVPIIRCGRRGGSRMGLNVEHAHLGTWSQGSDSSESLPSAYIHTLAVPFLFH